MLSLAAPTSPAWIESALGALDEVLLDHAHCEKKAAGMAVQMLFRYPNHPFLLEPLSRLAREELAHFEEVLRELSRRGVEFRRQKPSAYAGRLRAAIREDAVDPRGHLVDTLLCCALIEARSCERFQILAEQVGDPRLAAFYRGLLAAEARHHRVYLDLAAGLVPRDELGGRLQELAKHEAAVLEESSPAPRMHS